MARRRRSARRHALHPEAVLDVLAHVHVREQGVVLEHRVDVTVVGGQVRDVAALEEYGARRRHLEAGDHAQDRRLARARGAEHGEELAVADDEVHRVDGDDVTELLAEVHELDAGAVARACRAPPCAGIVSVTRPYPEPRLTSWTDHVTPHRAERSDPTPRPVGRPGDPRSHLRRDALDQDLRGAARLHGDADERVGRLHRALLVDSRPAAGPRRNSARRPRNRWRLTSSSAASTSSIT